MPALIPAGIALLGAEIGSALLMMYAVEISMAVMLVGGLAYSAMKQRQAKAEARNAYNAAQVDRLVNISSSTAPRELVLGTVRKGGAIAYKASTGAYQKDLYVVIALAGHYIENVVQYYLNDVPVTLDASGNVTTAPYATGQVLSGTLLTGAGTTATLPATYIAGSATATVYGPVDTSGPTIYRDYQIPCTVSGLTVTTSQANATVHFQYTQAGSSVKITTHYGLPGQVADGDLRAAFPTEWLAENVGTGIAYAVVRFSYAETAFPSGAPNVTALIQGALVYDPRFHAYSFSENPALLMRHVYTHPQFGKATVVTAEEEARFIAAANACDTTGLYHINAGNSILGAIAAAVTESVPLFRAGVVAPFGASAESLFNDLAQAMGGSWAYMGGQLYVKAGVYTAPVMALGDADLAVIQRNGAAETQRAISISPHKERAQKFNTVKVTIWDSGQDYKQTPLTPLIGAALVARDGVALTQELTFPAVNYAPQALHVAGIIMRDARDPLMVELPFKLSAYRLELFDNVSLTLSRFGWVSKVFTVLGRSWSGDGSLILKLKETTASITQMDAAFSPQGYAPNSNLPKPWEVGEVGYLTVTSGTSELYLQADGTLQSRMRISWPQVADLSVRQGGQIEVQYRLSGTSLAWTSLIAPGDETQVVATDVLDFATYVIRARAKTKLAIGQWNSQTMHQVVGKTQAPGNVTGFAATVTDVGIVLSWDACAESDYAYTLIRVGLGGWLAASNMFVGKANARPPYRPATGDYVFWAKHFDTTGHESAAAATCSASFTLSSIANSAITVNPDGSLNGGGTGAPSLGSIAGTIDHTQINDDHLIINLGGPDIDVELRFDRASGSASMTWDGEKVYCSKPLIPIQLGINNISATEPAAPFAKQVWLDIT